MTKNQPNISSIGEALNRRRGLHIPVILAMNDFLALRFVLWLPFLFSLWWILDYYGPVDWILIESTGNWEKKFRMISMIFTLCCEYLNLSHELMNNY